MFLTFDSPSPRLTALRTVLLVLVSAYAAPLVAELGWVAGNAYWS